MLLGSEEYFNSERKVIAFIRVFLRLLEMDHFYADKIRLYSLLSYMKSAIEDKILFLKKCEKSCDNYCSTEFGILQMEFSDIIDDLSEEMISALISIREEGEKADQEAQAEKLEYEAQHSFEE